MLSSQGQVRSLCGNELASFWEIQIRRYGKGVTIDRVILDRFEGELAVLELEAGLTIELPHAWLPRDAKEGDVLQVKTRRSSQVGAVSVRFSLDLEATAKRHEEALRLREAIMKGPKGDLDL